MKKSSLFFVLWACLLSSFSQAQVPSSVIFPDISCNNSGQCGNALYIQALFYDTITETLYIAGDFNDASGNNRRKVAAIDLRTGNLTSWNPVINNGIVKTITRSGNTVYIGGTFTQVNSTSRNYLAALNASTGALLAWNPNPNAPVSTLFTDGTYLFAGGNFTNISSQAHTYLAVYNVPGNTLNGTQPTISAANTNFDQVSYYNSRIYFRSDNSSGGHSIYSTTINPGPVTQLLNAISDSLYDYAISNNKLYCSGSFLTINGQPRNYCAAYNLGTSALLPWDPNPPNNGNCRYGIELHRDTALISCLSFMSDDTNYHYLKKYTTTGTGSYINTIRYYQTNLYDPHGTYHNTMTSGKDKLIEVGKKHFHGPYRNDSISAYCFKPNQPLNFSVAPSPVCQGTNNVLFAVPNEAYFSSYSWTYSGSGAVITGSSNSVTVSFSANATSGTLSVSGINQCGMISPPRSVAITVNPTPNASAGADIVLNCIVTQDSLNGSSTSSPVTYNWSGPNSFTSTFPDPPVSSAGNYILTVTNTLSGCLARDTAVVIIDTIRPLIGPLSPNPIRTCTSPQIVLDASTDDPADSLRWLDQSSFSYADPFSAATDGVYLLIALDANNGCLSYDTVTVGSSMNGPALDTISSIALITCLNDTIVLDGSSPDPGTLLFWIDLNNDTLSDPLYASQGGSYLLVGTDTSNGCSTSAFYTIQQYTTAPAIFIPTSNYDLNCSYSTVLLDGSSQTPNALLSWSGPGNFSSGDPATVNQTGTYQLTVTDPMNGCTSTDSISVGYQPLLVLNTSSDTLICNGSTAMLWAAPVGGSPPLTYLWSTGSSMQSITVNPSDTLLYIVSVTDGSGCSGTDTVTVNVPDAIGDSILAFQPCDSNSLGQLQVFAFGGIAPYSFSIDGGSTFQTSSVFPSLNYGSYTILIRDSLGCTQSSSASISTSSALPQPDFLVSTAMMTLDTFVIVDISNPRPDSVSWILPPGCSMINNNMFAPVIVNADTGIFPVTMNAWFGTCLLSLTKNVNIQPFDTAYADPYNNNGIQSVTLFPNPNSGQFSLNVQLYKKQQFAVMVYDAGGIEHYRQSVNECDNYTGAVTMLQPVPGTYILKVIAEYDERDVIFIIQ